MGSSTAWWSNAARKQLTADGGGQVVALRVERDLGSTVVAGVLWSALSPTVAFCYLAAWMLASLIASALLRPDKQIVDSSSA